MTSYLVTPPFCSRKPKTKPERRPRLINVNESNIEVYLIDGRWKISHDGKQN
jgi:hypothetical protein